MGKGSEVLQMGGGCLGPHAETEQRLEACQIGWG